MRNIQERVAATIVETRQSLMGLLDDLPPEACLVVQYILSELTETLRLLGCERAASEDQSEAKSKRSSLSHLAKQLKTLNEDFELHKLETEREVTELGRTIEAIAERFGDE